MRNVVKYLRRSQEFDLTQEQLAKAIGVSKATISSIENGANTSDEVVIKLANLFQKDPREIFFAEVVVSELTNTSEVSPQTTAIESS